MSERIYKNKKYCTQCLSNTGKFYFLKKQMEWTSIRGKRKLIGSGLYKCENCNSIGASDELYNSLRRENRHFLILLSTLEENN